MKKWNNLSFFKSRRASCSYCIKCIRKVNECQGDEQNNDMGIWSLHKDINVNTEENKTNFMWLINN